MRNNFDEPHVHPVLETQAGVWVYDSHFAELVWVSKGSSYARARNDPGMNIWRYDPLGHGITMSITEARIRACQFEMERPSTNSAPFGIPAPLTAGQARSAARTNRARRG